MRPSVGLSLKLFGALAIGRLVAQDVSILGQNASERFWLAGRYDGNRIIVYLDTVKFAGTVPKTARKIAYPIADGFFSPVGLPPEYVAGFQNAPASGRFKIGDRYDLLAGDGPPTTVTLSTLVGFESDEGVGNDSYIGALALPERPDRLIFSKNYYVVRRHVEPRAGTPPPKFNPNAPVVKLDSDPVSFDIQTEVARLITDQMKKIAGEGVRARIEKLAPTFALERFTIADGTARYYVWAEWRTANSSDEPLYRFAAWLTPSPALHFLAVEPADFANNIRKQTILNVVDLGGGRTGVIIYLEGGDGRELRLVDYKDGVGSRSMRLLHSLSVGE